MNRHHEVTLLLTACLSATSAVVLWQRPRPAGPSRARPLTVGVGILAALVGVLLLLGRGWRMLALLVVGAAVAGAVLALRQRVGRRRSATATGASVLLTCELLAAELAAGRAPPEALRRAADDWPRLAPVAETAAFGGDVPAALAHVAQEPGAGDLRLVGAAWAVAQRSGQGLADALGRVATAIRADQRTARVVAGELASARATARLIGLLPIAALVLGSGSGAHPWAFLLGTPLGLVCLAAGAACGLAGVWWIEAIADSVTR